LKLINALGASQQNNIEGKVCFQLKTEYLDQTMRLRGFKTLDASPGFIFLFSEANGGPKYKPLFYFDVCSKLVAQFEVEYFCIANQNHFFNDFCR
jgi:hypothetical protein